MPYLYPYQNRWAVGKGHKPGALHICMHTSGCLWVQNSACVTFYAPYLLNRPLGRQLSETQENPSIFWAQFLSDQILSCNPAQAMMSLTKANALPPATCSWKRRDKCFRRQDRNCWERHRISLMTRVPFPGSHTIPCPLPPCRRYRPPSHGASLQNCIREHLLVRGL